jgi:hypothetical protein
MATSTRGQQYWHAPVRCVRSNVRDMEGLAASVLLIAILLGVLLIIGGLVYLLAQRLPKRLAYPPRSQRIGGLGLDGSSWSCSSSAYGRGLGQPQTPSGSLRDRRRPARPGLYSPRSSRCARHHDVAGPRSGHGQSPREARCGIYAGWPWLASHSRTPKRR